MMGFAFSSRFFDDLETVELELKQDEIVDAIGLLPTVPEMGSRRIPASIGQELSPNIRKLAAKPFLVVYETMEDEGLLYVHGLVHQRRAR